MLFWFITTAVGVSVEALVCTLSSTLWLQHNSANGQMSRRKCLGQTAWLGQIGSNNTRLSTVLEKILETEESNKKFVCLSVNFDVKKKEVILKKSNVCLKYGSE